MDSSHQPIACSLSPGDGQRQVDEWRKLIASATSVERIVHGARITAPLDQEHSVRSLAARESACCTFLTIVTTTTATSVVVTITSLDPEAQAIAHLLAGLDPTPLP